MEQLVLVLVIAAVSLIKWLMEKSAEQRSQKAAAQLDEIERAQPPPRRIMRPIDSFPKPDETARRLREALGLPPELDLPLPRKVIPAAPLPKFLVEEVKFIPPTELRSVPHKPREAVPVSRSTLDDLLRSRGGLRKAILVQEILGTPKGLVF